MADQIVQVIIEIGHRAWYRKKATPERTHDWILFVRGSDGNNLSHFVEKIVFNLHESFNPARRVFKSPPYELRESGYGEFMPIIDIYFKNKGERGAQRKVTIQYYLNLNREDSPPIDNVRPEKLKFHNPADEFLEKLLKAGGVVLGPDGCPPLLKPRPPAPPDLQPNNSQPFDSRGHDLSDFLVDVDSAAKSATQLAKKRKRSTEANPMSNDSNSSNESLTSRRSSKSDRLDKDSDAHGTKRKVHASLFESIDDELARKKKKQASDKADSNKSRSAEQKLAKVDGVGEEKKHRSSKDEGHKHSSSSSKSHHRRDDDGRRDHREKSAHGHTHSKPKSADRNSRSSSRTPSKLKSSESSSGSQVHGGSSSSHGGVTSTHHRSLSSSSRHHTGSKGSKVEGGSRHSGSSQSQRSGSSSSKHRPSGGSHGKGDDGLSRKIDIQVRLSPVDIQIPDSANPRSGSFSARRPETSSGSRTGGPSPDGFSSDKPDHPSPVKRRPRNPVRASPSGYLPPTFELNGRSYDDPVLSASRKYDKLLDDMKSDDDEEEDGEIRSPLATEPPESVVPWKAMSGSDRKEEKSKESSLDRKKSSSSRSSSSATPRLEKPSERFPPGSERPSPKKAKSDWSSSVSPEKTSPDDISFSASHVKAKKSQAKDDGDATRSSKKSNSISKSGSSQRDSAGSHRTSEKAGKQTMKGPPVNDMSAFAVKSVGVEEKEELGYLKVEPLWDNSYPASRTNDPSALKKEMECYGVKSESMFYNEMKGSDDIKPEKEMLKGAMYSDRAPNGELLLSLVELKEKINRVTSAALLNSIVDVIQAAGKLKSDDEALEFDFCQLDSDTMRSVKQLLETVSD